MAPNALSKVPPQTRQPTNKPTKSIITEQAPAQDGDLSSADSGDASPNHAPGVERNSGDETDDDDESQSADSSDLEQLKNNPTALKQRMMNEVCFSPPRSHLMSFLTYYPDAPVSCSWW